MPSLTQTPTFIVSGSIASLVNERSRSKRAPLLSRLLAPDIVLYSVYVIYAFVPIFQRLMFSCGHPAHPSSLHFPFPGLLLKCLALGWAVSSPVRYMLSPPEAPGWEELVQEGADGVRRPRIDWRGRTGDKQGKIGAPWLMITACEALIIWACWVA